MRTFPCGPSREGGCWASRAGGYLDCAEGHFAIRKWLQGFLKLAFQSNHHHHHPPPPPPTHTHTHPASQPGSRCAGWRKDGAQRSSQQKPSFTTNWLQHACNQWTLGDRSLPDLTITPAPHVLHGCWNTLQSQGASALNGTAPKTWVSQSNSPELAVQGPPSPGSRKTATRLQALLLRTL